MKFRSCVYFIVISFFSIAIFAPIPISAKVLIMTHSYNQPEFIFWQYATFKKFLKDDYEFIVFDDAPNEKLSKKIQTVCEKLKIECIRVPQRIHRFPQYLHREIHRGGPSAECAETIQYMLNSLGFSYPEYVLLIDSDMVLIRKLSIEAFMQDYDFAAHPQVRQGQHQMITYLLPNLLFFNMKQLPDKSAMNFNLGTIDGASLDTGGYTHYYLEQHPNTKWLQTDCITVPFDESRCKLSPKALAELKSRKKLFRLIVKNEFDYEFYADYSFMHFRAGSNWNHMDKTRRKAKTACFFDALRDLLKK